MKENYDFEIEVDLCGNKLNAIINDNQHLNNYIFYLIKDGVFVQKQITKYVNSCTFELTDSGIYVVYGYVTNNVYKKSNSLAYFNDNLLNNFENFISKPLQNSIFKEKIDVPTLDFPFQNYCLAISKNNETIDFNSIPLNTNFISKEIYNLEKNGISIHFWGQNEPLRTENSIIIFSGYLDSKLNAEQLVSCPRDNQRIGNFAVSVISKDFCKNYNDYFGLSKFFYYESKSYFFISNCYHLLLKILTNSVFKNNLSLNIKKIRSNLCSVRHQMFQQNFSNSMLVEPIKQKAVFQEIIFDNNLKKFYFNNTSMMNSIMSNDDINIGEITKELLNNFVNFVNNNKSKFKYFDLTGGLDSRAVFALITNSPRNIQDSLFINSNSNRVEDYKIAQKLNSMYGFKPAIIHRTVQLLDAVLTDEIMRSYYMDTYYSHNLLTIKSLSPSDELHISGGLGEINCRPLYGRNFYNSNIYESISNKSYENSLSEYLSFMSDYFILESKPSFNYIIQEWKNATNVEGLSNCEKIDLLYLFYRNSYHFDTYFSTVYNSTLFYPLAHPLTFKALHAKLKKEININFQLSLIKELNPLLLMIEFEDSRDNRETQKYIDNNMRYISNLKRNFDNSDNQNLSTRYINELSTKYKNGKDLSCQYKTCIENDIKILFKRKILSKTDCISLYYFVNSCSNIRQIRELYNKLQSVIDQVLILDENLG